MKISNRS